MLNFFPRLRDTLTRGFWIGEEIAHAKPRQEYGVEPLSPDAGRGADAEREGKLVIGPWGLGGMSLFTFFSVWKRTRTTRPTTFRRRYFEG